MKISISKNQYMATDATKKELLDLVFARVWDYLNKGNKALNYSIWGGSQMCPLTQEINGWISTYWDWRISQNTTGKRKPDFTDRIAGMSKKKVLIECENWLSKYEIEIY